MPALLIFDLDGTLAESKQPLTSDMAALIAKLLERTRVAVISGGALSQFLKQIVAQLPSNANLANLYLLPTSGAALYTFRDTGWEKVYEERLSETDAAHIKEVMLDAMRATGVINPAEPAWGERIEYRGSQVTFSALGQQAPVAEKKAWDSSHEKRQKLHDYIAPQLPGFSVKIGGSTSIDVTKQGIDKAYGVRRLCERLGIKESDALYVGDELRTNGNDAAVFATAVKTHFVTSPADTIQLINTFLTAS